jgi:putative membrane protein
MMSWIRTATALIGFGFAIVQYLNHTDAVPGARPSYLPRAPEFLGLALIGCGILALALSIFQFRWGVRYLSGGAFAAIAGVKEGGIRTPVIAVATVLILIGVFAFFAVLLRLG